jgi:hypothetical protein
MKLLTLCFATLLTVMPSAMNGESFPRGFYVDFVNCSEFAGVGPVDLATASALVPSSGSVIGSCSYRWHPW